MRRTRRYFSTIEKSTSKESDGDAESSHDLEESNQGKKMSAHDEDILISIIMKFFTVIEDNSTIKLTPRKRQQQLFDAWTQIQDEFRNKTKVSEK